MRSEQCARSMNSDKQEANFITTWEIFIVVLVLMFSGLLSFWFLISNVEFDSNSSWFDRLNNFSINSLQKIQNYLENAISRITGTLMCKSG